MLKFKIQTFLFFICLNILSSNVIAVESVNQIVFKIGNPFIKVNENILKIDSDSEVSPIIMKDRTFIPLRSFINSFGGEINWEQNTKRVDIKLNENSISLWVEKESALVNNESKILDAPPFILSSRTMIPLRFITENFGYQVLWNSSEKSITITNKKVENIVHNVVIGDTLWGIANRYNISIDRIKILNHLFSETIYPGQNLVIEITKSIDSSILENKILEKELIEMKFLDIQELDNSILVELKYSTNNNFLHEDVYGDLEKAFFYDKTAEKLLNAQKYLKEIRQDYNLLIYDAARPKKVQMKMWELVKDTELEKYVANPSKVSMHSYGTAVDLTIVDSNNKPLDMGTEFDSFEDLAQPIYEEKFLIERKLTTQQIENRLLLRNVMKKAGFSIINSEWWHFNSFESSWVRNNLQVVE